VIRVAAVGDVHAGTDSGGLFRPHWRDLPDRADLFLLAGDLTRHGDPDEAAVLAEELVDVGVPTLAVLGNHDYHSGCEDRIRHILEQAGVRVLEGEGAIVEVDGSRVGVAGAKGFGGGFAGASASDFGEPEMKAFVGHTKAIASRLHDALAGLVADVRVVLLHFSPVPDTLKGERLEIYPFLGSYLLAEAVDAAGADLVLHGHAHGGSEKGITPGGVHVRNVAQPVIKHAYNLYCLGGGPEPSCEEEPVEAALRSPRVR
jgi:Icc-related predicted phosphoesterase